MKKIVLIICSVLFMFSCDEEPIAKIEADDVLGTWVLIEVIEDGEDINLNRCDLQDTITFTRTNIVEDFYAINIDSPDAECLTESYDSVYNTVVTDDGLEVYGTDEVSGIEDYFGIITLDGNILTFNEIGGPDLRNTSSQIRVYQKQ